MEVKHAYVPMIRTLHNHSNISRRWINTSDSHLTDEETSEVTSPSRAGIQFWFCLIPSSQPYAYKHILIANINLFAPLLRVLFKLLSEI